jgi:hypothetical protein
MRCSFYKSLGLFFLDSGKLPRSVEKHFRSCANCRESLEAQARLASSLRKETARAQDGAATRLHARIMHAVESAPSTAPAPVFWRAPLLWSTAAGAALLLALFAMEFSPHREPLPPVADSTPLVSIQTDPFPFMSRASADVVDPLELEIAHLKEDFKRAAQLFVLPF